VRHITYIVEVGGIKKGINMNEGEIKDQRETICKGCKTYNQMMNCSFLPVIYKNTDRELICPCSICLIKMMCSKGCREMHVYTVTMTPIRDGLSFGLKPKRIKL